MSNPKSASALDLSLLALFSLFFLLFNLHTGSLASWDESLYAQVALEAVRAGNWLDLTWQGQPWVDKPPVTIWATAFLYTLFGVHEWTARLFSALCGAGTVLFVYLLGRELFGRWAGFVSALVLLSSIHFIRMVRFGMTDGPMTFFVTASLYFFWKGRSRETDWVWAGVFFGLAFLTKSFAALFVPAAAAVYMLLSGDFSAVRSRYAWLGFLAALALVLPWNLYVASHRTAMYLEESLGKHFLGRTTQALEGHSGTWYFYIRTMLNKFRPWILVGVFAAPFFIVQAARRKGREYAFVAGWMIAVFAIVTVMKTKLHWYVLPIYPALSIAIGWCLARWVPEKRRALVVAGFLAVMAVHIFKSGALGLDYSGPVKGIAPVVTAETPKDATVFLYDYHEQPAAIFYWQRTVKYLDDAAALEKARAEHGKKFYCFISEKSLAGLGAALAPGSYGVRGKFGDRLLIDSLSGNG